MLAIIVCLVAIIAGLLYTYVLKTPKVPSLNFEKWWGVGARPVEEDKSIRPFKIVFSDIVSTNRFRLNS